jgi:hypothetical protein
VVCQSIVTAPKRQARGNGVAYCPGDEEEKKFYKIVGQEDDFITWKEAFWQSVCTEFNIEALGDDFRSLSKEPLLKGMTQYR